MSNMKSSKGNAKKSENSLRLRDLAKNVTFTPFPRLPIELRCQIWRTSWETDTIGPYDLTVHDRHRREPVVGHENKLPISSQVNQESREETMKMYGRVPNSPVYIFHSVINYKIDRLELDCTYKLLCPSMTREHFHRLERVTLRTSEVAIDAFYNAPDSSESEGSDTESAEAENPTTTSYKTLGNFFYYPKKKYFAALRDLHIRIPFNLLDISDMREDMRNSYRPMLFRNKGSGGVHIEPYTVKGYCHGFRVRFLRHSEITHLGEGEPAEEHQEWLDFIGETLWMTFSPECWLAKDRVAGFRTKQKHHQLL
ncbi:hypothetical protein PG993_008748 [Apiospora rasikravindrae]|uniref:2EXR domain-containing protein n=1 Tax=Apiospora rasikravindrae TaxID=990691 RepID=A0ABR1SP76_9PEZI